MKSRAAATSAFLSLLFLAVYGGSNYLASLRHNVGSFYFSWERHIPFVPLLIVPYMSIDLFFITAPFLCRSDLQRRTLARRVAAAILISGFVFFFFPLRFAFERPHVDGWLGVVFNNFRHLDQPYNQFPSLHIALCFILADFYGRISRPLTRAVLCVWFILIGLSAVLTYQHHIIDVLGGAALAAVCSHLIQDHPLRQPATGNVRVATYYLVGSILFVAASLTALPWTLLLLWPAASLALTTAAYFGVGAEIFRKHSGHLPWTSWLLLWPLLLGQRLSLIWYMRQCPPWGQVTYQLWIGRKLSNGEAQLAIDSGVTAVLDLTGEFSEARPFLNIPYRQLPIMDLTAPTPQQLSEAVSWITEHSESGIVYVHCKAGYSRTAAVAGAFLLASGHAENPDQALAMLRSARPTIVIRPEAERTIRAFPLTESAVSRRPRVLVSA